MDTEPTTDPFTRFLAAAGGLFPDFDVLQSSGSLSLHPNTAPVHKVRVQAQGAHFALQSVEIITVDELSPAALARRTTIQGAVEEDRPDTATWLDPDRADTRALRATNGRPAWIELTFAEPVEISRLTVHNVSGPGSRHLVGLTLTATTDDGTVSLYEAGARKKQLRRLASQLGEVSPAGLDRDTTGLLLILVDTMAGHYAATRQAYKKLKPDGGLGAIFRTVVSKELLRPRELEWTAHGAQRSFRFWPHEEKVRYVEYASQVAHDLSDLASTVCFGFGAALAAVRDGDLIPHDDDLDLIIGFDPSQATTLTRAHDLVAEHLGAKGYTVSGDFLGHRHVAKPGNKKIDVFSGLFEGDRIAWYPGKRGALHRENLFPPSNGLMLGVPCPLPRDPLLYLETVYGDDWRVPDPVFRHKWVPKSFADQRGEKPATPPAPAGRGAAGDASPANGEAAADDARGAPEPQDRAASTLLGRFRRKRR